MKNKQVKGLWQWALLGILLLGVALLFALGARPPLPSYSKAQLGQRFEQNGVALACPEGFSMQADATGLTVENPRYNVLFRVEDVTQAYEAHLEAGYTSDEAEDALLEAAEVFIQGAVNNLQHENYFFRQEGRQLVGLALCRGNDMAAARELLTQMIE